MTQHVIRSSRVGEKKHRRKTSTRVASRGIVETVVLIVEWKLISNFTSFQSYPVAYLEHPLNRVLLKQQMRVLAAGILAKYLPNYETELIYD